jgi:hypothetical protein
MKFFLLGFAVGVLILFLFITYSGGSRSEQPIAFNHKKHVDQGLDCDTCHRYYKMQTFPGMPDLSICLECHKERITQSPQEEKIRQLATRKEGISWKQIYGEPDHVLFSHQRHVVLGKIECKTCHGDIGQSEKPPIKQFVRMTMNWCMSCHARRKVTNDCLACHE